MKKNAGFTLVEIVIVVAIIGLLAVIAIPSFISARQRNQETLCIDNLRQISAAKKQWADASGLASGTVNLSELIPNYIKKTPECPAHGNYVIGDVNEDPTCSSYDAGSHKATL